MNLNNIEYKGYHFSCDIGMMTPCQYKKMIDYLELYGPKRIIELGSGQSTKILSQFSFYNHSFVFSIEHDLHYKNETNLYFPLKEITSLEISKYKYDNCTIYDGLEDWLITQNKFDFILVDGPNDVIFNNQNLTYGRIQLLSFTILNKLNDDCIVMYHDSEREIAQNTLKEFEILLFENNYTFDKEIIRESDKEIYEYHKKVLITCPELTIYKIHKNINI